MLSEVGKKKRGPKALIDYFYEKVDVVNSLIIVAFLVLVNILILAFVKMPNLGLHLLQQILLTAFTSWFLLGIILYLIVYFIRSKDNLPERPLEKILGGLAAFKFVEIIFNFLATFILFVFYPGVFTIIRTIFTNPLVVQSESFVINLTLINKIGIGLIAILYISFIVYVAVMIYFFIRKIFGMKSKSV